MLVSNISFNGKITDINSYKPKSNKKQSNNTKPETFPLNDVPTDKQDRILGPEYRGEIKIPEFILNKNQKNTEEPVYFYQDEIDEENPDSEFDGDIKPSISKKVLLGVATFASAAFIALHSFCSRPAEPPKYSQVIPFTSDTTINSISSEYGIEPEVLIASKSFYTVEDELEIPIKYNYLDEIIDTQKGKIRNQKNSSDEEFDENLSHLQSLEIQKNKQENTANLYRLDDMLYCYIDVDNKDGIPLEEFEETFDIRHDVLKRFNYNAVVQNSIMTGEPVVLKNGTVLSFPVYGLDWDKLNEYSEQAK